MGEEKTGREQSAGLQMRQAKATDRDKFYSTPVFLAAMQISARYAQPALTPLG